MYKLWELSLRNAWHEKDARVERKRSFSFAQFDINLLIKRMAREILVGIMDTYKNAHVLQAEKWNGSSRFSLCQSHETPVPLYKDLHPGGTDNTKRLQCARLSYRCRKQSHVSERRTLPAVCFVRALVDFRESRRSPRLKSQVWVLLTYRQSRSKVKIEILTSR